MVWYERVLSTAIEFTQIPCRATATASDVVNASTAALNAAYTGAVGIARMPSTDEKFTILPHPRVRIEGTTARHACITWRRFTR